MMRWFRDAFCDMEKLEAQEKGCDVYEILEKKAQKIPAGSYEILPIFSDSMKYKKMVPCSSEFFKSWTRCRQI
jgi:autoinducer 2 (AI-2) kinase